MDMPDTLGSLVLAFALESEQPGVRADVRGLVAQNAYRTRQYGITSRISPSSPSRNWRLSPAR